MGRQPKGANKKVRVSLTIDPAVVDSVDAMAKRSSLSRSELLENIVQTYLKFSGKKVGDLPYPVSLRALQFFCEKNFISKLVLFGSVVTGEFKPFTSDLDIMVKFEQTPGLLELAKMEEELKSVFSYDKIDLRTIDEISPEVHENIGERVRVLYEKAG